MSGPDLSDYIEVPERIAKFKEAYPEGSLTGSFEFKQVGKDLLIVYTAQAYRHERDKHPGLGTATEPYPGKTQFTRGSEIMNAETSAWGRALVAVGVLASNKIASAHEIRMAKERKTQEAPEVELLSDEKVDEIAAQVKEANVGYDQLCLILGAVGADAPQKKTKLAVRSALYALTEKQAEHVLSSLEGQSVETPA